MKKMDNSQVLTTCITVIAGVVIAQFMIEELEIHNWPAWFLQGLAVVVAMIVSKPVHKVMFPKVK